MYLRAGFFLFAIAAILAPSQASAQAPRMEGMHAIAALKLQRAENAEDEVVAARIYREVLNDIYTAISNFPNNATGYVQLGQARLGLGEYLAADSALDRAETIYPGYKDAEDGTGAIRENAWVVAYNEGVAALRAGDNENGLTHLARANQIFDRRPEAYINLGATYANTDQLDASIEAWKSAIEVINSPDSKPGDEETRLQWVSEFGPMALDNLAQVLYRADRAEEAVAIYEKILADDPDNGPARAGLAIALAQSGQAEGALSIYDEILESDDASALDYYNAGVTLYGAEAYDRATTAFVKVLERAPMYRDALQNLVQALALEENYEAQLPYSEKLLEMDGQNYFVYQMHLRALSLLGRTEDLGPILEVMEALTFLVDDLQLQPRSKGARVMGTVTNKLLEEGASVTLRFHFYDDGGNELGTQDVSVPVPPVDGAQQFQVSIDTETAVMGYSYEVMS